MEHYLTGEHQPNYIMYIKMHIHLKFQSVVNIDIRYMAAKLRIQVTVK